MRQRAFLVLRILALAIAAVSPARWCWDYVTATETRLSLHDATPRGPVPGRLGQSLTSVGGEGRRAIFAHPPSRLVWDLPMRRGRHRFRAEVALQDAAWEQSDGVGFRAAVIDRGREREILAHRLEPPPGEARWIPLEGVFETSGEDLRLVLETSAGGNADRDWALWGEPRLMELTAPVDSAATVAGLASFVLLSLASQPRTARSREASSSRSPEATS